MAITSLLVADIASADPTNSKNARVLAFDCGGEEVSVATIFHSQASVGNATDQRPENLRSGP